MITLTYNPQTGKTVTHYPDGCWSGCKPVPDDTFHAEKLGITEKHHRLLHEAAHHLVGQYFWGNYSGENNGYFYKGCPIIWRDAHKIEQPKKESELLEWRITSMSYHARERVYQDGAGFGALMDIVKAGGDPYVDAEILNFILKFAKVNRPDAYVKLTKWLTFKIV